MALNVSNYALQYGDIVIANVLAADLDLFITESQAISDAEVQTLVASGTKVVGYVNACVTDNFRSYWNPAWTSDGTDTGTVFPGAPSWLKTGVTNAFGIVVDYADPAWRQIVIDQAVALINRGYSGIFLDDVASYFTYGLATGNFGSAAISMMTLVSEIKNAIAAINPDAVIIVNGSPYIVSDATGGILSAASQAYLAAADATLLEIYFGIGRPAEEVSIQQAVTALQPSMQVLALEYGGTAFQNRLFLEEAAALGFVGAVSTSAAYSSLGAPVSGATTGDDTLLGTSRANTINALAGNDVVTAQAGNDLIYGGVGNDTLNAGDNDDYLDGGADNDSLYGDAGIDAIIGGTGNDFAYGGTGNDTILMDDHTARAASMGVDNAEGGDGDDLIWGFGGNDTLYGSAGNDTLVGNDFVAGPVGFDALYGGNGNDRLYLGLGGTAYENGGAGNDTLYGYTGSDTLRGGLGNDFLYGNAGADVFEFYAADFANGNSDIVYFMDTVDRLKFSASMNGALTLTDALLQYDSNPANTVASVYISVNLGGGQTAAIAVYGITLASLTPLIEYTL
jgi:uncharacterized protein (TIGR01370 family)